MCRVYIALFVFVVSQNAAEETTPHSTATPLLTTSSTLALDETLLQKCLLMEGFKGTKFFKLNEGEQGQVLGCMNREHASINSELTKQKRECNALQLLMGVRTEFEHRLMDNLLKFSPELPRTEDPFLKCIYVLHLQTGPLVNDYRRIITEHNMTFTEFCRDADTDIYGGKSDIIHEMEIPKECDTIEAYKEAVKTSTHLQNFLQAKPNREAVLDIIFELRRARLKHYGSLGTTGFPKGTHGCVLISNFPLRKPIKPKQSSCIPNATTAQVISQKIQTPEESSTNPSSTKRTITTTMKERFFDAKKIKQIFGTLEAKENINKMCEIEETNAAQDTTGQILVEFSFPRHVAMALSDHQKESSGYRIGVEIVNCYDFKCSSENVWRASWKNSTTLRTTVKIKTE